MLNQIAIPSRFVTLNLTALLSRRSKEKRRKFLNKIISIQLLVRLQHFNFFGRAAIGDASTMLKFLSIYFPKKIN